MILHVYEHDASPVKLEATQSHLWQLRDAAGKLLEQVSIAYTDDTPTIMKRLYDRYGKFAMEWHFVWDREATL